MIDIREQKVENCNVEVEPDMIFEPDEDFYKSISIEEFQERAIEVVETAYKRFTKVVEPDMIFEPDEDFYKSITIEEVREKLHGLIDKMFAKK